MRSTLLFFAIVIHAALFANADAQDCGLPGDARCEPWLGRQDHYPIDSARALAASPTGDRVFLTGASTTTNPINNLITIAYDRDGNSSGQNL